VKLRKKEKCEKLNIRMAINPCPKRVFYQRTILDVPGSSAWLSVYGAASGINDE
jgi:hypothetical protein